MSKCEQECILQKLKDDNATLLHSLNHFHMQLVLIVVYKFIKLVSGPVLLIFDNNLLPSDNKIGYLH